MQGMTNGWGNFAWPTRPGGNYMALNPAYQYHNMSRTLKMIHGVMQAKKLICMTYAMYQGLNMGHDP